MVIPSNNEPPSKESIILMRKLGVNLQKDREIKNELLKKLDAVILEISSLLDEREYNDVDDQHVQDEIDEELKAAEIKKFEIEKKLRRL